MTYSTDLKALGERELFQWLMLAQNDLEAASNIDEELEAEALCDTLVAELVSRR